MCIHVLRYISLDSVLERQCVILSVSRLLPSKPLPSSSSPTLLPPLGFAPPAFIFQVAYGSSPTLYNGCPSFLTFTGRPFLMTHGLDPCFPDAIALPWLCSCLLPSLFTVLQPFKLILLILRFSLFKIMSIICKQTLANKLWEYSSILKESLFENLRTIVTLNWSMNSWSVYLCVLNTSSSKHGTTVTYPVDVLRGSVNSSGSLNWCYLPGILSYGNRIENDLKFYFFQLLVIFGWGVCSRIIEKCPRSLMAHSVWWCLILVCGGLFLGSFTPKSVSLTQRHKLPIRTVNPPTEESWAPEPSGEPEGRLNPLKRTRSREKGRMITFPATQDLFALEIWICNSV